MIDEESNEANEAAETTAYFATDCLATAAEIIRKDTDFSGWTDEAKAPLIAGVANVIANKEHYDNMEKQISDIYSLLEVMDHNIYRASTK